MLYYWRDGVHMALTPARMSAELTRFALTNPYFPPAYTQTGRWVAAQAEIFERLTRDFAKPEFGISETTIDGRSVAVEDKPVLSLPYCDLLHFERETARNDPKVLIVAPMSGHYATLLRGTVRAMLPHHDVYITDWHDAAQVPHSLGTFNLDDFISYVIEYLRYLGPETHVIAVCQPAMPVMAASCVMTAQKDPAVPKTMTLMGGPIDTRVSKTAATELAEKRDLDWFEQHVVHRVPFYYPGAGRRVYPGFLQLGAFMSMNLDRHVGKHFEFFQNLIEGDNDSAGAHRKFYDEYRAVMDLDAEFYLQTVEVVFQKHLLPKGEMVYTDPKDGTQTPVKPDKLKNIGLLTIEGEKDDISALGQTLAAHTLCTGIPESRKYHHYQLNVGHYGIFNGSRWRTEIMPRIRHFIRSGEDGRDVIPKADLKQIPDLAPEQWNTEKHSLKKLMEISNPETRERVHKDPKRRGKATLWIS